MTFRFDNPHGTPPRTPVSAAASRERMIQEQVAAGEPRRKPMSSDLRHDTPPPQTRLVSAREAREAMIRQMLRGSR